MNEFMGVREVTNYKSTAIIDVLSFLSEASISQPIAREEKIHFIQTSLNKLRKNKRHANRILIRVT